MINSKEGSFSDVPLYSQVRVNFIRSISPNNTVSTQPVLAVVIHKPAKQHFVIIAYVGVRGVDLVTERDAILDINPIPASRETLQRSFDLILDGCEVSPWRQKLAQFQEQENCQWIRLRRLLEIMEAGCPDQAAKAKQACDLEYELTGDTVVSSELCDALGLPASEE